MIELKIHSREHTEFIVLTPSIQRTITEQGWKEGVVTIYVPHTTAGVAIQENADPDVVRDMIYALEKADPWRDSQYRHGEGNTAAHVKAAMLGSSAQCLVEKGRLRLGAWQGIFFCEFDGPRNREVWVNFCPTTSPSSAG